MPERIQSGFSRLSLFVEATANGLVIGRATGFVIRAQDQPFLVTNWHVLSGRNAETNACLSDTGALPDFISIHHHGSQDINTREPRSESLYVDAEENEPRWLEHPRGREIDVVLLPLTDVAEPVVLLPLDPALARVGILELPGLPVSVIGFPYGFQVAGRWPIWKTGHIASDPGHDYDGRPSFLIDITTREGMSGAPIVYQSSGPFDGWQGKEAINAIMQRKFLGVYSGRLREDSEIARGWPPRVIEEILNEHGFRWRTAR